MQFYAYFDLLVLPLVVIWEKYHKVSVSFLLRNEVGKANGVIA